MDHPTPPSPPPAIIKELENTADATRQTYEIIEDERREAEKSSASGSSVNV
jgi:hypothetical protein